MFFVKIRHKIVILSGALRGCDFFNFPCSSWPESSEEHLPNKHRRGPSSSRHKLSDMR